MAIKNMSARLVDVGGVINPVTGGTGMAVDGVTVIAGDDVLLPNPPNGNGYAGEWIAAAGAWTRSTDWDTVGEMEVGDNWTIREGSLQNTVWAFEAPVSPATINVSTLTIGRRSHRRALEEGAGISISGTTPPIISLAGGEELNSTFIEGLTLTRLGNVSLRIAAGGAHIPGIGTAIDMPLDADLTAMTLTPSTTYHVYFTAANNTGVVEYATQGPTTLPYRGESFIKGPDGTSDPLRRWIGRFATDSSGNIIASSVVSARYASDISGGLTRSVVIAKSADQAVTNSTTLVNDTELFYPIRANESWVFEGWLLPTGSTTGDIKVAFTAPATVRWQAVGSATGVAADGSNAITLFENQSGVARAFGILGTGVGTGQGIMIRGYATGGVTGGTVQVQWAQNALDAVNATTMRAGSYLIAHRVL